MEFVKLKLVLLDER